MTRKKADGYKDLFRRSDYELQIVASIILSSAPHPLYVSKTVQWDSLYNAERAGCI